MTSSSMGIVKAVHCNALLAATSSFIFEWSAGRRVISSAGVTILVAADGSRHDLLHRLQ